MLHLAAAGTSHYRNVRAAIDDKTTAVTEQRLAAAHTRIDRGEPLTMREFDLIHGLTGIGVYHLHRHPGIRSPATCSPTWPGSPNP
ncbi:hypothetical protein QTQ03_28745 [Micromonospora sp. WMMA1363]|uniref:hypothetical protein n=1 Tax=Micromonospora sp. WMMA1363 TaxID=3053985 RepID=UPI00259D1697|nr:hypothetical protein [Micromonospora sp. WMMA1363]MDM4723396.1 hypothetical protein [Micromonospora sp. WMMA1363]